MSSKWVTFFSQTGSEIAQISSALGRWPDLVVTNRGNLEDVNNELKSSCWDKIYQLPKWPKEVDNHVTSQ